MTRFVDRLLASPGMQGTRQAIDGSIVILGDNVSDYYWMGNPQEVWDLEKDFPNIAPPFERFFIDFRAPAMIMSEVNGQMPWHEAKAREWGVFFECDDVYALAEQMELPDRRQRALAKTEWHLEQVERMMASLREELLPGAGGDSRKIRLSSLTPTQRWHVKQYQQMRVEVAALRSGDWPKAQRLFLERHQETSTRWLVRAHLYLGLERTADYLYVPAWLWDFPVTAQGQFVVVNEPICYAQPKEQYWLQVLPGVARGLQVSMGEATHRMYDAMMHYFYPALLTISFMHCKNVMLEQVPPSRPAQHTSKKKAKKRTKSVSPRITYHILNIEPMKQVLKTEGHIEQQGLKKALHICRGHFANYESGKGLFGKYHGTYWIPQHLRGSAEQGIRVKDYRIADVSSES